MPVADLCNAAAMDAAEFGAWGDAVPPCDAPATVQVGGYALCVGCAEALDALAVFARRLGGGR